jgi:hypothetical protein
MWPAKDGDNRVDQVSNILQNGSLGEGFYAFRNNETLLTAVGWAPWWYPQQEGEPDWRNRTPVYYAGNLEGNKVQQLSTPWGTHDAGLLQQAPAAAGNRYELTVEGQAWSSEVETPGSQVEASDVNMQIGIDPTGGLDPTSPLVKWSETAQPLGRWEKLVLTVTAEANIMTIYLRSAPTQPKRQQTVFWRNALLTATGRFRRNATIVGAGDTHILLEPEQPRPSDRVTALVSSTRNHVFIDLLVRRPDGELAAVAFQGMAQDQARYTWRYQFLVAEAGLYDVRLVGDKGARLLAQQLLRISEKDWLAEAAETAPGGQARIAYHRVYVLLPPTADIKWLLAAARGSFEGRYTIGFSADDAGVGELESRHVLAVNPHHWSETLTAAWFHNHYPGARFTAVVANRPEDLEAWLRNWVNEV